MRFCSKVAVLNSSPRTSPLSIFRISLFVKTPDSDNQLVRSALRAWTVFRLTQCPLLPTPWAGKIHWSLLHFGTFIHRGFGRSYTAVNIYNLNSQLAHFNALEYIRSLWTGIMAEYSVMSTSQGTYVRIEQTSEAIRVTYEMCRAGECEDWNWEPLL